MKRAGKKPITTTTPRSTSSSSSSTTPRSSLTSSIEQKQQQQQQPHNALEFTKDSSCYFPGCRKDANCTCEMCLDSINATLDLKKTPIPSNNHNSIRPIPFGSPSSFAASTPRIATRRRFQRCPIESPCLKSTGRAPPKAVISKSDAVEKKKKKKWRQFGKLTLGFVILILGMELGFSWIISRALKPELSVEIVRDIGERAFESNGMNSKLWMLESELKLYVNARISNCSHNPKAWEVSLDGLLLTSRCVLYKSGAEEVSVWGWPLHTAGMLVSRFSSRSLTVLSGRVTQWNEGNAGYVIVKARESMMLEKHSASAVQLDGNTWVIEYSRSFLLQQKGLCSAAWRFFEYYLPRASVRKMSLSLGWLADALRGYSDVDGVNVHPT